MSFNGNPDSGDANWFEQLTRQLVVIAIASGILIWGVWTLFGNNAPYHPEGFSEDQNALNGAQVTRSDTAYLLEFRPPASRGTVD